MRVLGIAALVIALVTVSAPIQRSNPSLTAKVFAPS